MLLIGHAGDVLDNDIYGLNDIQPCMVDRKREQSYDHTYDCE